MIDLTATINNDEALRKLRQLQQTAKQTTSNIVSDADRMDMAMARLARTLGQIGAGISLVGLVKQIGQVRSEFQQLEIAFSTMLKSEAKASALMSQLTKTAATTPFGLQDVANGAKQLLAYGTSAEKVNETLIRLGDIAAGLSIPLGDLVYLFGTTQTQGRLYTQDFNQFLNRGIPLAEELAKMFDKDKSEIKKMVTEGKIGFPEVEKAIISMTSAGGKFGGLMEAQSKTIGGLVSNLEDAFDMMFNEIGKDTEGIFVSSLQTAIKLVENYEKVLDALIPIISAYGTYKAALITVAAAQKALLAVDAAKTFIATARSIGVVNAAMKSLNLTMAASPWALLASLVVGAGVAVYRYSQNATNAEKATRELHESLNGEVSSLDSYFGALKNAEKGTKEYKDAIVEINSKYGSYFENQLTEKSNADEIAAAYDRVKNSIMGAAMERARSAYLEEPTEDLAKSETKLMRRLQDSGLVRQMNGIGRGAWTRNVEKLIAEIKQGGGEMSLDEVKNRLAEITKSARQLSGLSFTAENEKYYKIGLTGVPLEKLLEDVKAMANAEAAFKDFSVGYTMEKTEDDSEEITRKNTKNKAYWETKKKNAESALEALDVTKRGSSEWNKQLAIIKEADAALAKYNTKTTSAEKLTEARQRSAEDLRELLLNNDRERAQISEIDRERKLLEIEAERSKALADIDKQKNEFAKSNKKGNVSDLNADGLTSEQQAAIEDATKIANEKHIRATADLLKADAQSMRDYLKEYGSLMAQKYAIAEEYEEKISKASNEGEKKRLQAEKRSLLQSADVKGLIDNIDWYTALSDANLGFSAQLEPLYEQLKQYTQSDKFTSTDAAAQKAIVDAMKELRRVIGLDNLGFTDLRDAIVEYQSRTEDLSQALEAEKAASEQLSDAKEREKNAATQSEKAAANDAVKQAEANFIAASEGTVLAQNRVRASSVKLTNTAQEVATSTSEVTRILQESGIPVLGDFFAALDKLKGGINTLKAIDGAMNGVSDIKDGTKQLKEGLKNAGEESGEALPEALTKGLEKAGGVGIIISAVLQILEILKDGVGKVVADIINLVLDAINNIVDEILSGQIFERIGKALIKAIGNILNTITRAIANVISFGAIDGGIVDWISGGNAEETKAKIERLTQSNEDLKNSIDELKEEISNDYGTKSIIATQKAIEAQKKYEENLRQILDAQMGYHNSHHSNSYYWNLNQASLNQINELLDTQLRNSWSDFSKLTADQMAKIRSYLPEIWREMINQGKYGDRFEEDWQNYADAANGVQELVDTLHESLTQISFDSLRDSFIDTLMDMEANAETFTNDFAEMFQRALLSYAIGDKFNEKLKKWYTSFAEAMERGKGELTQSQLDNFRKEYENMASDALNLRDQIADITGYGSVESDTEAQKATTRGFESMDQDTASELNGRFTDMQGKMAEQLGLSRQALEHLAYFRTISEQQLHAQIDTRDILINIAGNVSEIKAFTEALPMIRDAVTKTNKILDERL